MDNDEPPRPPAGNVVPLRRAQPETHTWVDVQAEGDGTLVISHWAYAPDGFYDSIRWLRDTKQYGSLDMRLLMKADGVMIEKWCNERRIAFNEFMANEEIQRRFINDPDNSFLRIWKCRV